MGLSTRRVCGSPRGENGCWRCGGWAPTGKYGAHRGAGSVLANRKPLRDQSVDLHSVLFRHSD